MAPDPIARLTTLRSPEARDGVRADTPERQSDFRESTFLTGLGRTTLEHLRSTYHPLHYLRSKRWLYRLMKAGDIVLYRHLAELQIRVALRAVTHLSWILGSELFEPQIRGLFARLLRSFDVKVFWDVGANIGYYSWLVKHHSPNTSVVLFEPDPMLCNLIERTINRNAITDATLVQRAVSSQTGLAQFALDEATSATGTLETEPTFVETHFAMNVRRIQVQTTSIDDQISQGFAAPDLIKIDVEGSEHKVFEGCGTLLRSAPPIFVFECFDQGKKAQIAALLTRHGYALEDAERCGASIDCATNILAIPEGRTNTVRR